MASGRLLLGAFGVSIATQSAGYHCNMLTLQILVEPSWQAASTMPHGSANLCDLQSYYSATAGSAHHPLAGLAHHRA
jgi:hypothetical protein